MQLHRLLPSERIACQKILLPVSFDTAWPRLFSRLQKWKPDLVVLTGEGKSKPVTLETAARNQRRGEPENRMIDPALPSVQRSPAAEKLAGALHGIRGISIEDDPGDYLCNYTYFLSLALRPQIPVIFLHVSPIADNADERELMRIRRICERAICLAVEIRNDANLALEAPGQNQHRHKSN